MKNLTVKSFLEFVEIKTKVASFFPMLIGVLWSIAHYHTVNWLNTLVFVLAAICFDMCTTAINNTMDYKKALDKDYKRKDNVIGRYKLDEKQMVSIIFMLLAIATILSLILVALTDVILLPIGALCFLIGIFYTFGPIPLSRMPLGEVFSGVTMGFGIFFIAIFIQNPQFLQITFTMQLVTLNLQWQKILLTIFMSLPLVCLIANIMLANNLCDYEQDIKNNRFTLVHYISKPNGIKLYVVLSIIPWICWISYIIFGLLPIIALVALIPAYFVYFPSIKRFIKKQIKRETFIESIKSFVLFSSLYAIMLMIDILF